MARTSSVVAFSLLLAACWIKPPARGADDEEKDGAPPDPSPRWESAGETAPPPDAGAAASGANKKVAGEIDLDELPSASDMRASIGGKEIVFKRALVHGNTREGFGLHAFEGDRGQPAKGEMNARFEGAFTKGRSISVSLTFLQVADDGPLSFHGARALECNGKGKLVLESAPTLPKQQPKEEVQAGSASGTLTMTVKCTGDAKELGSFTLTGKLVADVLVTPPES